MSHRPRLYGVLTFLSCGVLTLLLAEGLLRLIASLTPIYSLEMVKYAKELKMPDPSGIVSHVHRPGARAKLMGVSVELNSLGIRGPELSAGSPSEKRILVLGGSATLGWGVPYEQVFTSRLERELNSRVESKTHFDVLNAGVGNYNTASQRKLLERLVEKVRPDEVVLNYFLSDVEASTKERSNSLLKYSFLADLVFEKYLSFRALRGDQSLFSYYEKFYRDGAEDWSRARADITQMRDQLNAMKVPFLIVISPELRDLSPSSPFAALYAQVEASFRSLGIQTLNTFPVFQRKFGHDSRQVWVQPDDPHPNASGHALLAEALLNYFVSHPDFLGVPVK